MTWSFTPLSFLLVLPGLVAVAYATYIWRRGCLSMAWPIVFLSTSSALWALIHVGEVMGADLSTKLLWAKTQYVGSVFVPVAWLTVALQFTNRQKWLTVRNVAWLSIVPVCALVLTWTNDWHGLIWSDTYVKEAVVDVNLSATRLFGQPARALMGLPIREVVGHQPDLGPENFGQDRAHAKLELGTGAGSRVVAADISLLRDSAGEAAGRVMVCRDITDRKRLEARVQQAEKLELVGRLAGGVAHDFNNLLMVIAGESERLTELLDAGSGEYESAESIQ